MPSIFLSHNSKDKFFVRELAARLQARQVEVWVDEAEIRVGDSLTDKIGSALRENQFVGVVLSANSVTSEWVKRELQVAIQREFAEKRVVVLPILVERVDIPPFLADKLYADFTKPENYNDAFAKLLDALGVPHDPPEPMPTPTKTPYRPANKPVQTTIPRRTQLSMFEDIAIVDLEVDRSHKPDPSKSLLNMYLRLSKVPPADWAAIFAAERGFPRHSMWRRAWIEGGSIVIHCVPDELERYHMRDLQDDVRNANAKYRQYLMELELRAAREAAANNREEEQLHSLRKRLGFD